MPAAVNRTVEKVARYYEHEGEGGKAPSTEALLRVLNDTERTAGHSSTLGGFWLALSSYYKTRALVEWAYQLIDLQALLTLYRSQYLDQWKRISNPTYQPNREPIPSRSER